MTKHPGYVWLDDSDGTDYWVATCPKCDWTAHPTTSQGLAFERLRDHKNEQRQGEKK